MPDDLYVTGRNVPAPSGSPNETQGRFFSSFPAATPKFALNEGPRRSEFTETMARMIIDVPREFQQLRDSLPGDVQSASRTLLRDGKLTRGTSNGSGVGYFDFLLTNVQQGHQEREQVVDTLTDNTVIFYGGQSAPMLNCSGTLLNSYQDDQNVWFQLLYSELLRGTMLARRNLVVRLRYDSFFMTGYLSSLNVATEGGAKNYVQFSFTFRIKQIQITTPIIYNPSYGRSLLVDNLFTRSTPLGSDDTTRVGVETAETPATPTSVPAASTQSGIDPREAALRWGVPQQTLESIVDAVLAEQQTAELAQQPTDPAAAYAFDQASSHNVEAGGDVRANLRPEDLARIQDFTVDTQSTLYAASRSQVNVDPLAEATRTAARGTVTISPVTGLAEASGVYADSIARATPNGVAAAPARVPAQGPGSGSAGPAPTLAASPLQDVYRPPGKLLRQALDAARRGNGGAARTELATLRTRQRLTP